MIYRCKYIYYICHIIPHEVFIQIHVCPDDTIQYILILCIRNTTLPTAD